MKTITIVIRELSRGDDDDAGYRIRGTAFSGAVSIDADKIVSNLMIEGSRNAPALKQALLRELSSLLVTEISKEALSGD